MLINRRILTYLIIILIFVSAGYLVNYYQQSKVTQIPVSELIQAIKNKQVEKISAIDDKVVINLTDGSQKYSYKESTSSLHEFLAGYGIEPADLKGVTIELNKTKSFNLTAWWPFLVSILIISVFLFFFMRQIGSVNSKAIGFTQSNPRLYTGRRRVTFDDVAGLLEAKQELGEVVDFLKRPDKFKRLGAKIPHGVLLMGPPGTGKTLLAKAVAGEANVPFFSISGSEFMELFVGVGAARVRDLFAKARRNAPCIIFIDELDAIGRYRGTGLGGGQDEREQTLNQILVEMDGFDTETNVIVLAATNRPDTLDPALLRPGRFDRRIVLNNPDVKEREEILKIHSRNKPLAKDVDLNKIARQTAGFSGADLENLMNEAAILAGRLNKNRIGMVELEKSIEKVMLGAERSSHLLSAEEKKIAAYHEAGHALISSFLPECDPVHKISIVSRGFSLGYTWMMPKEEKKLITKTRFENQIAVLLGGYATEKIIFGQTTTGAQDDLKKATDLARSMVMEYGMSEKMGPIVYGEKEELIFLGKEIGEQKNYSDETAAKIDEEIAKIIGKSYQKAKKIIKDYKDKIVEIAQKLIEEEVLEGEQLAKLLSVPQAT